MPASESRAWCDHDLSYQEAIVWSSGTSSGLQKLVAHARITEGVRPKI
jgi:hypothetical protein